MPPAPASVSPAYAQSSSCRGETEPSRPVMSSVVMSSKKESETGSPWRSSPRSRLPILREDVAGAGANPHRQRPVARRRRGARRTAGAHRPETQLYHTQTMGGKRRRDDDAGAGALAPTPAAAASDDRVRLYRPPTAPEPHVPPDLERKIKGTRPGSSDGWRTTSSSPSPSGCVRPSTSPGARPRTIVVARRPKPSMIPTNPPPALPPPGQLPRRRR